jgi:hypothetical protein
VGPLVLSPFVLAELNYTISMRYGQDEFFALLSEVSRGLYLLEPFSTEDIAKAQVIVKR